MRFELATATVSGSKPRRQCDITREANALARKARVCEQCGIAFTESVLSSKQIAAGQRQRFCSVQCTAASKKVYASKADAKRAEHARARARKGLPPVGSTRPCIVCGGQFPIATVNTRFCSAACSRVGHEQGRVARETAAYQPRSFCCHECGNKHTTQYGATRQRYCSQACMDRSIKRTAKTARSARKRVHGDANYAGIAHHASSEAR